MKFNLKIITGILLVLVSLVNSFQVVSSRLSPLDRTDDGLDSIQSNNVVDSVIQETDPDGLDSTIISTSQKKDAIPAVDYSDEPEFLTGYVPDRLLIPDIDLDAVIVQTKTKQVEFRGQTYYQWRAPGNSAVGWHESSALLGLPGNTVLNGHHNTKGEVFKNLVELTEGDLVQVYSGERVFEYQVALIMILDERFKPITVRFDNAQWISPSSDERLTLITCWPPESNTHRVIVVALPKK
jgi:LPXTG-site transpeptidase (sortase) family protein